MAPRQLGVGLGVRVITINLQFATEETQSLVELATLISGTSPGPGAPKQGFMYKHKQKPVLFFKINFVSGFSFLTTLISRRNRKEDVTFRNQHQTFNQDSCRCSVPAARSPASPSVYGRRVSDAGAAPPHASRASHQRGGGRDMAWFPFLLLLS